MSAQARDILRLREVDEAVAETRVGRLLAYLGDHRAVVDIRPEGGPSIARCLATIDGNALAQGAAMGARVRLVFENGDASRPIVTEFLDQGTRPNASNANACDPGSATGRRMAELHMRTDGEPKRLRVEAGEELVLECGRASIALLRDGRIVIKGAYVETCASGTNRIKGAQVRIN
jgi:hypothetical protein